jgi:hypothetical protein
MDEKIESDSLDDFLAEAERIRKAIPDKINATPENASKGLVQLVLALVELIRQLMEKQALRRIEKGNLTEEEIERVGLTLMQLENKMEELKAHFDLTDDDLKIDLGPLGNLT